MLLVPTTRRRTRLAAGLAAAILLVTAGGAPASAAPSPTPSPSAATPADGKNATFGIGPSDGKKIDGRSFFNYLSSPGGQLTDHVGIVNLSAQPQTLRVYATDAVNATDGAISYLPASAHAKDAGTWVSVATSSDLGTVTLAAGASTILPMVLKVPAGASPGDHTAGLAVSLTSQIKNDKGQNINFEQRVVSRVYVRVSGQVTSKLTVDQVKASFSPGFVINPFGRGHATVSYRVRNTGNVILGGRQSVTISGWYGGTSKATVLADLPQMLPGGSTVVVAKVPDVMPAFHLTATATVTPVPPVNAVDPEVVAASSSATIWAVPWLLVVLLAIVVLALGYGGWSRLRRRSMPPPPPSSHRRRAVGAGR